MHVSNKFDYDIEFKENDRRIKSLTRQVHEVPFSITIRSLTDNAINHHDLSNGNVQIKMKETEGFLKLMVANNGVGIPVEHHEKIFQPFKTLKSKNQVEG